MTSLLVKRNTQKMICCLKSDIMMHPYLPITPDTCYILGSKGYVRSFNNVYLLDFITMDEVNITIHPQECTLLNDRVVESKSFCSINLRLNCVCKSMIDSGTDDFKKDVANHLASCFSNDELLNLLYKKKVKI